MLVAGDRQQAKMTARIHAADTGSCRFDRTDPGDADLMASGLQEEPVSASSGHGKQEFVVFSAREGKGRRILFGCGCIGATSVRDRQCRQVEFNSYAAFSADMAEISRKPVGHIDGRAGPTSR